MDFFKGLIQFLASGSNAGNNRYDVPDCSAYIVRTFHIALIGLSPDGNSFMSRSEGKLNNVGKKCFFKTIPWSGKLSGKLSTIVGLDCYFSRLDAIVLEMSEQSMFRR